MASNISKFSIEYLILDDNKKKRKFNDKNDVKIESNSDDFIIPKRIKMNSNELELHPGLRTVTIKLEGMSLWKKFHSLGTEMIVTKSGR